MITVSHMRFSDFCQRVKGGSSKKVVYFSFRIAEFEDDADKTKKIGLAELRLSAVTGEIHYHYLQQTNLGPTTEETYKQRMNYSGFESQAVRQYLEQKMSVHVVPGEVGDRIVQGAFDPESAKMVRAFTNALISAAAERQKAAIEQAKKDSEKAGENKLEEQKPNNVIELPKKPEEEQSEVAQEPSSVQVQEAPSEEKEPAVAEKQE